MYMFDRHFRLYYNKALFLADFLNQLCRSFLNLCPLKDLLSVFRTPYQVVTRIIDRMTRSFDEHEWLISYPDARSYEDQ